jgi:hypothetical protein
VISRPELRVIFFRRELREDELNGRVEGGRIEDELNGRVEGGRIEWKNL